MHPWQSHKQFRSIPSYLRAACALALVAGTAAPGWTQSTAPAPAGQAAPSKDGKPGDAKPVLPPVTVTGSRLDEERRVGKYNQPEWTAERRFVDTRIYVLPEGMFEFEQWWRGTYNRDDSEGHRFLSEIEAGLPGRWQLDLYGKFEGATGQSTKYIGEQLEARYALANWGRLPANPTLYLEWENNHIGAQVLEGKLLLGDEFRHGWHWGANLSYEEEMGGSREIERMLTLAASRSIKDSRWGVGVEAAFQYVTAHGEDAQRNLLIGPSIQYRPTKTVHIDVAPLFGVTHDAPRSQIYVVIGVNLRQGEKGHDVEGPISSRAPH